jgi:glyoxylase-like metal-dependent hydrolase (beta-lactamase superfamily II)
LQITSGRISVLRQVADGVLIHKSEFVQSNAVVVQGETGVLLIDPGVYGEELNCLANDLSELDRTVVVGFSTHPHWDHLLWHERFGEVPRYGTSRCATTVRDRLSEGLDPSQYGIPEHVPLDLLGELTDVPVDEVLIPWDGTDVRIFEHQAHAPGHAALVIEERRVLVVGDMLSDVLIPLLDFNGTADPIEDYLGALQLFERVAGDVDVLIPGHGSFGDNDELHARIALDRAYVLALRDGHAFDDPRFSIPYSKDWLPGVHARQLENFAARRERDAASDEIQSRRA